MSHRPLVVLLAAAGCVLVLAVIATPAPRRLRRRPSGLGQRSATSFAVIGEAALALLLAPPDWGSRVVVVVAVTALAVASLRLAVLLRDVTALHAARALAATDEVTGLGNRRALLERISALQQRSADAGLLVLHLDTLQEVNDTWGRDVGDDLLRAVGLRLDAALPPLCPPVRVDGGAFAVLLPTGGEAAVEELATLLRGVLSEPFALPQGSVGLHPATGGALVLPDGAAPATAVDVLRRAETAATLSRTRDGAFVLHAAAHDEAARTRADLAAELGAAIDGGQLLLHYQPQVARRGGTVHGVEALVRWVHPVRGLVPPDVFVPLAEQVGLQGRLTSWVLEEAVREAAAWLAAGTPVPVSVNLAPSDVHPGLVHDVARVLAQTGLPARALVLEITETGIVSDPEAAARVLTELVALGVEVSIDDYGTGYSSLSLLMGLPVTELKIDRVFVRDLETDRRSAVVVRTTVDLAHSLGLRVVAEGVETEAVLDRLGELGCDVSQGYLHSRPLPAAELRAWLAEAVQHPVQHPVRRVGPEATEVPVPRAAREPVRQVVGAAAVTGP